jgi:UDP:flavonoid glycosyltransferase YjiC (YdhE family)
MHSRRILLTTYGSLGDLHPYLALAIELKRRGHSPAIATSELYRSRVEALEIDFAPVRPDLPSPEDSGPLIERVMHPLRGPEFLFRELLMPHLHHAYEDLEHACRDADLLISHPITFAAPLLAQKKSLPWLSTVLSPISLWSRFDPPVPPVLPLIQRVARQGPLGAGVLQRLSRVVTASWLRPVQKLRRELGLPPSGHPLFEGQFSPSGNLALFSPVLGPPQPDWPARTTTCGFCFFDREHEAKSTSDGAMAAFLEAGSPPLVFTLGSAAVYTARDFFQVAAQAAQQLGCRAVFLVGQQAEFVLPRDSNFFVANYAPYSQLFPRAAVVVHQGGIGTTAQALRAGVPQLVVPFSHDQPDNAARIVRLGCGLWLSRDRFRPTAVAEALKVLLSSTGYRKNAQQIGAEIQKEDGPRVACDAIGSTFGVEKPENN